jgi:hypothetical protein
MLESSPDKRQEPRTLYEARQVILRLKNQLSAKNSLPAGTEPIPKAPQDPHPILPGRNPPINPDLGGMSPKARDAFLEEQTTPALYKLIKKEDNPVVYNAIYRVIKRRPDR